MFTDPHDSPLKSSSDMDQLDLPRSLESAGVSLENTPLPFRRSPKEREIPSLASTLLFLVISGGTLFVTEIGAFGFALETHLFGRENSDALLRDPRLLIPSMALAYLISGLLLWAIFTNLWRRPFAEAIRWNGGAVQKRSYIFIALGIGLSLAVQFLSNYLPIPKTLPIDDFFRTSTDVWFVAIFGTFIAPAFEELAFRGFLVPSLASAWDWMRERSTGFGASIPAIPSPAGQLTDALDPTAHPAPGQYLDEDRYPHQTLLANRPGGDPHPGDPHWSRGAQVVSSILTSIAFALIHADQLAHSWTPLAVLFAVSIVLCAVRLRFHSLAASTMVHAVYNGTIFALLFYATDGFRHLDKMNL